MERNERIGVGLALAGHGVLFGLLSVGFLATPNPERLRQQPVEVSLVPDVALEAAAPAATEAPSQAEAPAVGAPADAPPPAPAPIPLPQTLAPSEFSPVPTARPAPPDKPAPRPEPRPKPQPAPEQAKPEPKPQPKPAPAKPAAKPQPAPKPVAKAPDRPRPKSAATAAAKPTTSARTSPPKAAPAKSAAKASSGAPARATPATRTAAASGSRSASATRGQGSSPATKPAAPRQSRLGPDFLKGLTAEKSATRNTDAPPAAARVDARTLASIVQAIARQIQPCADQQVDPGPGANQIVTTLNLRLNRDGTLSATPRMVRQTGVTDDNQRYAQRVADLGIAAFKACSPLRLPAEYYSTANGGWSNINYNWKLR